jgi:hypothetical protein
MRKLLIPAVAIIALISFTISGCSSKPKTDEDRNALQPDDSFQEVKITGDNSTYSMRLPDYLTEGNDLNDEASLQYQNIYKEVYVIVIDEPKQDFIDVFMELGDYDSTKSACDNYTEAQMESIEGNMEAVTSKSTMRKMKINGNEARVVDVTGTQAGITDAMGFTVGFVEGKESLYMIMTWTFEKDKAKYQDDMDMMINSFKEI